MSIFAPSNLFAAVAIAADGDADVERGTHVRLLPSVRLGLPMAPVALWRVQPQLVDPDVLWTDAAGAIRANGDLDAAGGLLYADIAAPAGLAGEDLPLDVAVDVGGSFDGVAALLDGVRLPAGEREFCRRSSPPYLLGAPRVDRLRLQGRGLARLTLWRLYPGRALEQLAGDARPVLLSLPIEGSRAWYAGGLGEAQAADQVRNGAPKRLTPADRPDGPFEAVTPDHEWQRVEPQARDIVDACERLVADPAEWPSERKLSYLTTPEGGNVKHFADIRIAGHLLTQALDPGLARFIGLATRIDDLPSPGEPVAWVALSLLAVRHVFRVAQMRSLYDELGEQPAALARVVARYVGHVEAARGEAGELRDVAARVGARAGAAVRTVLCACAAVPPPDRPVLASPQLPADRARWIGRALLPADAFRQDFLWPLTPMGGLVALGRLEGTAWVGRHATARLTPGSDSPPRATPLLLGRSGERGPAVASGLLSDSPIPADPDDPFPPAARYRVAIADLFGRFGAPVDFDVPVPPRPAPPEPRLQAEVVLDGPAGNEAGLLSPGHLRVTVPVPHVADLPAGSLRPARLELSFDGALVGDLALDAAEIADLDAPRTVPAVGTTIALPPLTVAARADGTLGARFRGPFGAASGPATLAVAYNDRRPWPPVASGLGLVWTSRPGPAPEVELRLSWPAPAGASYRVFIADAASLGLAPGPRAHQAVEAGVRARQGTLGARARFRLLGDVAESAGRATVDERLPRSLATLQVLKIVPVSAQGREAPFESCPVVPVAVPSERRAPMASVAASVDPLSGAATVRIVAEGFDWAALAAAEPGLFADPPDPAARAPEFRLRRAFVSGGGAPIDPLYAREVARGRLTVERSEAAPGGWRAVAVVHDAEPLPPFVRVAWWAEVRPGAERRVRAGHEEELPAGGVVPAAPQQRADLAFAFSLPSAPATAMRVLAPAGWPDALDASVVDAEGKQQLRLEVATTPRAHARAVASYRLRLWEQWGDEPIQPAGPDVVVDGQALVWNGQPHSPAATAALLAAWVDPLDRVGAMLRIDVA